MTKKRHTASRMLLALVALTLVSFCFLGSTFARYTSTDTGTATTEVALWDIDITGGGTEGSTKVSFAKLSPSMAEWQDGSTRSHSTALTKVAAIANNGEVGAKITLTADAVATFAEDAEVADIVGVTTLDAKARFTIALYWSKTDNLTSAEQATAYATNPDITLSAKNGETVDTVYIYAVVTWTSLDTSGQAVADALDTWIGENITEVSWGLSYTAVQNTQLP